MIYCITLQLMAQFYSTQFQRFERRSFYYWLVNTMLCNWNDVGGNTMHPLNYAKSFPVNAEMS